MVASVFEHLKQPKPKRHFTIGIYDDVTHLSLPWDSTFTTEADDVKRAVFYGLGSDGTVGANKNSVKIIGENTPLFAQGYFVYDSKKSGAITVSHLRFSPRPIRSTYLIDRADFVACHQFNLLEKIDVLKIAADGATFLLNSPYPADRVWDQLPREVQQQIIDKRLRFFVVDGYDVARQTGMGARINTPMQACFFALAGLAAARGSDRAHQDGDSQDVRQARRDNRRAEFRGHRHGTGAAARGRSAGGSDEPQAASAAGR